MKGCYISLRNAIRFKNNFLFRVNKVDRYYFLLILGEVYYIMENIDSDHSLNGPLESANRLLSDLERKLSISSTTSSNQTQQSQHSSVSSVVINKNFNGIGKRSVQSGVLLYINDNDNHFNTNDLFHERQKVFLTKFVKNYNDDSAKMPVNQSRTVNLEEDTNNNDVKNIRNSTDSEAKSSVYELSDDDDDDVDDDGTYIDVLNDSDIEESDHEMHEDDSNFLASKMKNGDNVEVLNDENNEEEMHLPPSPPRSPPRLIDPEKLYGLYDFVGPDPLHCKLSRDEPVQLINDQDNYWWLIRKLTKEEKKLHKMNKSIVQYENGKLFEFEDDGSDEEGKVGFVPAECLETYGERLARLNCFKNEELEKDLRDNIKESKGLGITLEGLLGIIDEQINSSNNENGDTGKEPKRLKSMKSVTFENLDTLKIDEEDDDYNDDINNEDFNDLGFNPYYQFSGELYKPPADEEKASEVLSDVFPVDQPLVINKNKRKTKALKDIQSDEETLLQPPALLSQPKNNDNDSIGSFSPDTPKTGNEMFSNNSSPAYSITKGVNEVGSKNEQSMLRRSVILERLNQVTTDIQAFQLNGYETFDGDDKEDLMGISPTESDAYNRQLEDDVHLSDDLSDDLSNHLSNNSINNEPGYITNASLLEEADTPLTSMNSLNNGCTPTASLKVPERRHSKPVLDMFVPILGKFDELAEKLARLNEIL